MGKGSGSGSSQESALSNEQAKIARDVFERTGGLRGGIFGAAEQRLGLPNTQQVQIGVDPQGNPIMGPAPTSNVSFFGPMAPEREALELGFRGARENILSNTPTRGGQLNKTLSNLEVQRAQGLGAMEAGATERAFGFGSGAALQAPELALTGLGSARAGFTAQANREAQASAAKGQGTGQLLGDAIGATGMVLAAGKMCWVALALYDHGPRFYLARSWILGHWEGKMAEISRRCYRRYGERVAALCRFRIVRSIIKPLFNMAVRYEMEWIRNG